MEQLNLFQKGKEELEKLKAKHYEKIDKLLSELEKDVYAYDLRNWKDNNFSRKEIIRVCNKIKEGENYVNVSGSSFFGYVLPTLLKKGYSPETIADKMIMFSHKNVNNMKKIWLSSVEWGYQVYLNYKKEGKGKESLTWLEHSKRAYGYYFDTCNFLGIKPKSFEALTSNKFRLRKKQVEVVEIVTSNNLF